jgi:membrane protease YdiL (CAAX protease family)
MGLGLNKAQAAGLLIALVGAPVFVVISDRLFGESPTMPVQVVLQVLYCGMAAFLLWFVLRVERLPLTSIGLRRPTWLTVGSGLGLLAVSSFVLAPLMAPLQKVLGTEGLQAGLDQLAAMPGWFRVVVGITGGMMEDLFYRGYAIERLATLTGRAWIGGLISAVAFGLAHIPAWGLGFALAADMPFGLLMTAFYLWRRDLLANMLAHSTGLVIAMFTIVP